MKSEEEIGRDALLLLQKYPHHAVEVARGIAVEAEKSGNAAWKDESTRLLRVVRSRLGLEDA